ncbi:hypothetical protein HHI36_009043 [Cryptolaemus montrouzieri]|uniref:t-SNARE coiled-coil homology domain-containing protein n=1 Tax=Cryptolaemus montrouzieri TaxID=559131 RepID=A0ABD2MUK6_9CUCU
MVRDRLLELKEKAENSIKISPRKDTSIKVEEDPLKNVFSLAEQISEDIEKISENVDLCKCYMRQISESPFREKELSDQLTKVFEENGKLTQKVNNRLKQFENHVKNINKTCTVGRIEIIQYSTLRTRFRDNLQKNNEEMENFRTFRLNTYKAQLKAKGVNVTEQEFSELMSGDEQRQIFIDNLLVETAEARRLLSEAEELNEQLLKIEGLITEIRDLFVQMSILVEEQQELVDVVEYQAQQAVDYVSKTPHILREAEGKKNRALKMKFLCYGIVGVVLILIVLSIIYG